MKNAYIVSFKHVDGKEDGLLTAIEQNTGLPFPIGKITAFAVQLVTVAYTGTVLAKGEVGASSINFLQNL